MMTAVERGRTVACLCALSGFGLREEGGKDT